MSTASDAGGIGEAMDDGALFRLEPAAVRCPFATYERHRSEEPVFWEPSIEAHVVTRYDDIVQVTSQPTLFSSRAQSSPAQARRVQEASMALLEQEPALFEGGGQVREPIGVLVNADPPAHSRQKALVNRAFSTRRVREMEDALVESVDRLIGAFDLSSEVEIVQEFAAPLPLAAIIGVLGVPADRMDDYRRWSDDFLRPLNPRFSSADLKAVLRSQSEYYACFTEQIAERRLNPRDDLLTALVEATIDGEALSEAEMLEAALAIMVAGNETTAKLITAAVLRLARDPELAARLREQPELVPEFAEEVLRLETPAQGMFRVATADTEVGGVPIPEGGVLFLAYASGNRDATRFEEPDELRPGQRTGSTHLAFGHGVHFCLGAPLARAEIRIAIQQLLARFSEITVSAADADLDYFASYQFRGLNSLRVRLTPAA